MLGLGHKVKGSITIDCRNSQTHRTGVVTERRENKTKTQVTVIKLLLMSPQRNLGFPPCCRRTLPLSDVTLGNSGRHSVDTVGFIDPQ